MSTASKIQPSIDLNYPLAEGRFDEARLEDGSLRKHWSYLFEAMESLGRSGMTDRQLKANRLLRDDGANYARSDAKQRARPWTLDPVPLLIDSSAWSEVELGLIERSELFDLMLRDLYSERALIRSGTIPAEIIINHPGFLRVCHGSFAAENQQLIIHGVDLIRNTHGQLQILCDRTQSPSGAGYALLNRTVMSRIMPSVIRDSQIHRLAVFFQTLRRQMASMSGLSDPRIVVMTPGAFSETYFEHSYLANYLGYSLVQGSDLVVKDGYVWMRSLDGLHRVDVILRRLDDTWCDPVELRPESQLGVPGLLEVIRAGNVRLANPLGAGILENPILLRYMEQISEFYLSRPLKLKSVKTWWPGDPDDRKYVLENLDKLIIKSSERGPQSSSVFGPEQSKEQLSKLKALIKANPKRFIAQVASPASAAPSWQRGQFQSMPAVLRTFAVADQGSYSIMAGGLTRTATSANQSMVTNQIGAISKDTWVLASEPQSSVSLLPKTITPILTSETANTDLPSRVVENLFWMGRYAERAESTARLLRSLILQFNSVSPINKEVRTTLLQALTDCTSTHPGFYSKDEQFDESTEFNCLLADRNFVGSLPYNLQSILNCTEEVRDMLSSDTHRVINDLREQLYALDPFLTITDDIDLVMREEALDGIITSLMALVGLTHESMVRGIGWRFLELGRRLERGLLTGNLLRTTLREVRDPLLETQILETLLLSSETKNAYMRRYPKGLKVNTALPIMMLDPTNPRSLIYQLKSLQQHLSELASTARPTSLNLPQRSLLKATTELQLAYAEELASLENGGIRFKLDDLLILVNTQLSHCAQRISDIHFEQASPLQQLNFGGSGE